MDREFSQEELEVVRDFLRKEVEAIKAANSLLGAVADMDLEGVRNSIMAAVRGAEAEKDVEVLSLIASWFVLRSDRATLLALLMFLEDE